MLGGRLLVGAAARSTASRHRTGCARSIAELRACHNVRLMPRTTVFGVYDGGIYGAVERVADHVPVPPRASAAPAAPGASWRSAPCLPRAPSSARIAFAGNDRPGVMLGSAVRSYLNRFAVAPGTSRRCVHQQRRRLAHGARSRRRRRRGRGAWSIRASDGHREAGCRRRGRSSQARVVKQARGGHAAQQRHRARRQRAPRPRSPAICSRSPAAGIPTLHLTCHLGGKPVWQRGARALSCRARCRTGMTWPARRLAHFSLADASPDGARLGAEAASESRLCRCACRRCRRRRTTRPASASAAVARARRHAARPSSICRTTSPPRTSSSPQREGFRVGRASQALHHARHGAPTRARRRMSSALGVLAELTGAPIPAIGTTTFRPPYTPVAIGALAGHHRGKDFRPTRLAAVA